MQIQNLLLRIVTSFRKLGFPICALILSGPAKSQNFEWTEQMGGTSSDAGQTVVVDAAGNVYTIGRFQGTSDFDPGIGIFNLTSTGSLDIFVSKLDASGNFVWAKQMGGTGLDAGASVAVDATNNVYTTGLFSGTADFDPGIGTFNLTSSGGWDIFVSKFDASGNFVWAKKMGGAFDDGSNSIAVDQAGNVYTTGQFLATGDFDPGVGTFNLTATAYADVFISKLDVSGNFIWAKKMGGKDYDQGFSIAVDHANNVYTTGYFRDTADFDPGVGIVDLISMDGYDAFVSKLDASGNFIWAKQLKGSYYAQAYSIAVDLTGNVYTTGCFQDTTDFDPGPGIFNLISAGGKDVFVNKLDASGNFIWAKQMKGPLDDEAYSIAVDATDNVYTIGYFQSTTDFDPGAGTFNLISLGANDIFVNKLDGSGNFIWAKQLGGTSVDIGCGIAADACKVFTTGYFNGTADFDPGVGTFNLISAGSMDIFLSKLSLTSTNTISATACSNYISPSGNYIWTMSGVYMDTISNATGCDSIITVNLTINTVDTSVTNTSSMLTANASGANYQWLDCENSFTVISGATNQSFTSPNNGTYAVIITQNGCSDTSACKTISSAGIDDIIIKEMTLYPNPSRGAFIISLNKTVKNACARISNLSGQSLMNIRDLNGSLFSFNLQHLSTGIYIVELIEDQNIWRSKIVLN